MLMNERLVGQFVRGSNGDSLHCYLRKRRQKIKRLKRTLESFINNLIFIKIP